MSPVQPTTVSITRAGTEEQYLPMGSDFYDRGTRVHCVPRSSSGLLVHQQHLDARADGPLGALASVVPGHGGDVWFVHMDSGRTAVFSRDEMRVKVSQ